MSEPAPRRLLVVEDEMLIAFMIEDFLVDLGYAVVGPVTRLAPALDAARSGTFDGAILDINLAGKSSFPVAEVLIERGIPFLFASGYGAQGLNEAFLAHPVLQKPFTQDGLKAAVARLF